MSIALPVHVPQPTFSPGSTIAGHFVSRDTTHLLHNTHRRLVLYETQAPGTVRKVQEFVTKGTTGIHLIPSNEDDCLDAFVMVGDLVDWYSIQKKGTDAIHDFTRLESQEQLMQYCRTVPYIFVCVDPQSEELSEMRRFYFAEDHSPTILTHLLPGREKVCVICTSSGLIGVLNLSTESPSSYYKVRGSQNSMYKYATLSNNYIAVLVELNGGRCVHFLHLNEFGILSMVGTYASEGIPLDVGPVPSRENSIACLWFAGKVEFIDYLALGGPKAIKVLDIPSIGEGVHHAPQLSEPDAVTFLTSSYLARVLGVGYLELVEVPKVDRVIGDGSICCSGTDLVQIRKYNDRTRPGWLVTPSSGARRVRIPFTYELETISARGCELPKKEFSSWSHCFDPYLGSSFLTAKDGATYAVCRKSGQCSDQIENVIQLWQHKNVIIATTKEETTAFYYKGTPRLNLIQTPLFKGMDSSRTYAFKDGVQVTGKRINFLDSGESFPIPLHCAPVIDATCVDKSKVVIASHFNTFAISNGQIVGRRYFHEPVTKIIAADGILATMTLQHIHIEHEGNFTVFGVEDRLADVVVTSGHVVATTFDGSVYLDSHFMCKLACDRAPAKLVVAGTKALAVTEVDAVIVDTLSGVSHSAQALSGCNGGFAPDNDSFVALKNGNMWICDLSKMNVELERTSQTFIGPIKVQTDSAPQWSWAEKLACKNAVESVRFDHEVTDVCPVHPMQSMHLQKFDGITKYIEPRAYLSSFETLYLWADIKNFDLFKRLLNVQKRLETSEHTLGGCLEPKWLEWRGFVDGGLLRIALQNPSVHWVFEEEGVDAIELKKSFELLSF